MTPTEAHAARDREVRRRRITLTSVLGLLVLGVFAFYTRQSLLIRFSPETVTRSLIPAARMPVPQPVSDRPGRAEAIPVLVYHGVLANADSCNITFEDFRAHMTALKAAGYRTLTLDEFRDFIARGRRLPARSVLITFDDGRTDSFAGADPVLQRLGFHATMFAILGDVRSAKAFYLTAPEISMMARTGRWDVESHTTNLHEYAVSDSMGRTGHALATRLWDKRHERLESDEEYARRVRRDLTEARMGIESLSGAPVSALAFPFGDFAQDSEDGYVHDALPAIVSSIYDVSFREQNENLEETYDYPFDRGTVMRRIYVYAGMSAEELMRRLDRGLPKTLPLQDTGSFASSGWVASDGHFTDGGPERDLVTGGHSKLDRVEAFLDGSRAWTDYAVDATFSLQESETVGVVARRMGPNDYVAATISRSWVSIEQYVDGKRTLLGQADVALVAGEAATHHVRLTVKGASASLGVDGVMVVPGKRIDPSLSRGGIGMRVDPPMGCLARLHLESLVIRPLESGSVAEDGTTRSGS